MAIEIIDELVPKNDGYFGLLRDTHLIGGYRIVDNSQTRDAIPSNHRVAGMRVRTSSTGQEWILGTGRSNAEWAEVRSISGNGALAASLSTETSTLTLHVSDTGNDSSGDGLTFATAWRDIPRALNEIPDGALGIITIQLHGVGPFSYPQARDYRPRGALKIIIMGDTDTPTATYALPTGLLVPNGAGAALDGYKAAVLSYNVGSYSAGTYTNGSHWIQPVLDAGIIATTIYSTFGFGFLMDGANSASPNIQIVTPTSIDPKLTYPTVKTHAFKSIIDQRAGEFSGEIPYAYPSCDVRSDPYRQSVFITGCIVGPTLGAVVENVSLEACLCPQLITDISFTGRMVIHSMTETNIMTTNRNMYSDFNYSTYFGIFEGTESVHILAHIYFGGIVRNTTTEDALIMIGTHSSASVGVSVSCELNDLQIDGVGKGVYARNCDLHIAQFGPCSVGTNITGLVTAVDSSACLVSTNQSIYGRTSGVPFVVGTHSILECTGQTGVAPKIRNGSVPGNNIVIGGNPGAFDFSGLPYSDVGLALSTPNDCQFARAR